MYWLEMNSSMLCNNILFRYSSYSLQSWHHNDNVNMIFSWGSLFSTRQHICLVGHMLAFFRLFDCLSHGWISQQECPAVADKPCQKLGGSRTRDPQAKRYYSTREFYHWTKPAFGEKRRQLNIQTTPFVYTHYTLLRVSFILNNITLVTIVILVLFLSKHENSRAIRLPWNAAAIAPSGCDIHFKHIMTVSSQRLHILKVLKRQGLSLDMLHNVFMP